MPTYSKVSRERLETCCPELRTIFHSLISRHDHSILCGARSREEQETAFREGRSKLHFGESKHNVGPGTVRDLSDAIDAAPYLPGLSIPWPPPIPLNEQITASFVIKYSKRLGLFYVFAGRVLQLAEEHEIALRWGGDWDRDDDVTDQSFDDLVHFEVIRD